MSNKFLSLCFVIVRNCKRFSSINATSCILKRQVKISTFLERTLFMREKTMGCSISKVEKSESTQASDDKPPSNEDEYVEDIVCCESEIGENEMKVFDLKDAGKVLLVRQKGRVHALGTKCTHYGAPLVNGALGDGRIRCQWHGACFNIQNGDIEDFPGLDSLPCHQVIVEKCQIKVRAKRSALENPKRTKPMCKKLKESKEHFVVIGGGPAGAVCVETLRQNNFTGSITLLCKENILPYDRVKVSKVGDFDTEKNQLRSLEFYKEYDIDVKLGKAAEKVDTTNKEVVLDNGEKLNYDKLFVATGSYPVKLNIPGIGLGNVFTMRNFEDGKNFVSSLTPEKKVVIIGSSFIGMEATSCCFDKVKSVTIVTRSKTPFKQTLGEEVGQAFMKLLKAKGVAFVTETSISKIMDDGKGNVSLIQLENGTNLETDILLLGLGSKFYTGFLQESKIKLRKDGSIEVDDHLRTNIKDVFAGGDIAFAPVYSRNYEKATIGHFQLAHYHGKVAALNMLDKNEKLRTVPFFWTTLFGKSVRYAGSGSFEDVVYVGNVEELKFVAFYINENEEVVAASSCGMDPIVSQFAELLYQGKKLYRTDIQKDPLEWLSMINPSKE